MAFLTRAERRRILEAIRAILKDTPVPPMFDLDAVMQKVYDILNGREPP